MERMFFGNMFYKYLTAAAVFIMSLAVIKLFQKILINYLKKRVGKTMVSLDDFLTDSIEKIVLPFFYFTAFYLSLNTLNLIPLLKKMINTVFLAAAVFSIARFLIELLRYTFKLYLSKRGSNAALECGLNGILRVAKVMVWGITFVFFLDNLGFKISAVITGLGIGGIAAAMAAQAVLKDMFSYFSILFDRPFEIGDFIIVGDYLGTVEHIGVKTTRIRSLSGEQIVFSNTDLTDSRVRNYKRMEKRRVVFKIGVTYQTPSEKLKEIPKLIENIIRGIEETMFDRAHFFVLDACCLTFEIVYYVLSSDYNKYMDIQQKINFAVKEELEKLNIEFACPAQTLYVAKS